MAVAESVKREGIWVTGEEADQSLQQLPSNRSWTRFLKKNVYIQWVVALM